MSQLGELIGAEIRRRGLTQTEAAREMGVGDSPLSKWLGADPPRPSPESCARIASFLGLPVGYVQQLTGYPSETRPDAGEPDPEWLLHERRIKELYQPVEREHWEDLTELIEAMIHFMTGPEKDPEPPAGEQTLQSIHKSHYLYLEDARHVTARAIGPHPRWSIPELEVCRAA